MRLSRRRQIAEMEKAIGWVLDHRDHARTIDELHSAADEVFEKTFDKFLEAEPFLSLSALRMILDSAVWGVIPDRTPEAELQRLFWQSWIAYKWEAGCVDEDHK